MQSPVEIKENTVLHTLSNKIHVRNEIKNRSFFNKVEKTEFGGGKIIKADFIGHSLRSSRPYWDKHERERKRQDRN